MDPRKKSGYNTINDFLSFILIVLSIAGIIISLVDMKSETKSFMLNIFLLLGAVTLVVFSLTVRSRVRVLSVLLSLILIIFSMSNVIRSHLKSLGEKDRLIDDLETSISQMQQDDKMDSNQVSYQTGLSFLEKGSFDKAIQQLRKVDETSVYYADAQNSLNDAIEKYKRALFSKIDELTSSQDFNQVFSLLHESQLLLPEDIEINVKYIECKDHFIETKTLEASNVFTSDGYLSAINLLTEAKGILGEGADRFDALITEYQTYAPIPLQELPIWQVASGNGGSIGPYAGQVEDNVGNVYYVYFTDSDNTFGPAAFYNIYDLSYSYSTLRGRFCLANGMNSSNICTELRFYKNYQETPFQTFSVTGGTKPIDFEFDISDVEMISVKIINDGGGSVFSNGGYAYLVQCEVQK